MVKQLKQIIRLINDLTTHNYKYFSKEDETEEKMAIYIPKFLLKNLSSLYSKFKFDEFHFQEAVNVLGLNERYAGQILSRLVESGWISKKREHSDARKKIYRIIEVKFEDLMKDIGNESNDE
jgi:hypothetical protein